MKEKSKRNEKAIKVAYQKGYRAANNGDIISPKGNTLNPMVKMMGKIPYFMFHVRVDGIIVSIPYHRFIAYQKYGDIVFGCDVIRHLDGNSTNNALNNIEMGTYQENSLDIPKEIRVAQAKHASSYVTVFDDKTVKSIKQYHSQTNSYKMTMEKFGISSKATLHNILHNR